MKASELRIGNKFRMTGGQMAQTVFEIIDNTRRGKIEFQSQHHKEMYSHLILCEENGNQYKPFEMDGIPLTEEWLLKFGFEPNGVYSSMRLPIPTDEVMSKYFIVVTFDEEAWLEIHYKRKELCGDREIERDREVQTHMFRCAYVHQLQNLYFALTGEELTIKE